MALSCGENEGRLYAERGADTQVCPYACHIHPTICRGGFETRPLRTHIPTFPVKVEGESGDSFEGFCI